MPLVDRQPKPQVGHHRDHDGVVLEAALLAQVVGAHRDDVVAVDDPAVVIDGDQPVGVTVERDADVRARTGDRCRQGARMRRVRTRR